jgi:hypothetical protein
MTYYVHNQSFHCEPKFRFGSVIGADLELVKVCKILPIIFILFTKKMVFFLEIKARVVFADLVLLVKKLLWLPK